MSHDKTSPRPSAARRANQPRRPRVRRLGSTSRPPLRLTSSTLQRGLRGGSPVAGSLAAGVGVTLQREPAADEPASPTGRRTIRRQSAACCQLQPSGHREVQPATIRHHRGHGLALHAEFRRPSPLGRCPGINKQSSSPARSNATEAGHIARPIQTWQRDAAAPPVSQPSITPTPTAPACPLSHAATRPRPAGPQEPTASGGHRHQAGGGQRTTPVVLVRFLFGRKWKNSLPTAWSESGDARD